MYLVESLTRTQAVEDLGVTVSPSLPVVISGEDFAKSLCLAELVRQGHLRVSRTSLCREELPAKQTAKRKPSGFSHAKVLAPPPALQSSQGMSREDISEVVATTVQQTVATTVRQATAESLKEAIESLLKSALDSAVKSAVEKTLSELPSTDRGFVRTPTSKETPAISGEAPMFIPSGLVPKEVSGEVSVVPQTQSSEGLGDSASALRKLRKGASK